MPDVNDNKWLIVRPNVELTPAITPVIIALDPAFEMLKIQAEVTSGLRTPQHQLEILRELAAGMGLDAHYSGEDVDTILSDGHYIWQAEWSYMNHRGVYVNPPKPAKMLYRYISPNNGLNLFGTVIDISSHMKGLAFDVAPAHESQSLTLVKQVIDYAISRGMIKVSGTLQEDKQGAVHITCLPV